MERMGFGFEKPIQSLITVVLKYSIVEHGFLLLRVICYSASFAAVHVQMFSQ